MRFVLLCLIFVFTSFLSSAQDYDVSIGLHAGNPLGGSFKKFLHEHGSVECIVGAYFPGDEKMGFMSTGLYAYHIYLMHKGYIYGEGGFSMIYENKKLYPAIDLGVGFELSMQFSPIQFAIHYKPYLPFKPGERIFPKFNAAGLSVRYILY